MPLPAGTHDPRSPSHRLDAGPAAFCSTGRASPGVSVTRTRSHWHPRPAVQQAGLGRRHPAPTAGLTLGEQAHSRRWQLLWSRPKRSAVTDPHAGPWPSRCQWGRAGQGSGDGAERAQ